MAPLIGYSSIPVDGVFMVYLVSVSITITLALFGSILCACCGGDDTECSTCQLDKAYCDNVLRYGTSPGYPQQGPMESQVRPSRRSRPGRREYQRKPRRQRNIWTRLTRRDHKPYHRRDRGDDYHRRKPADGDYHRRTPEPAAPEQAAPAQAASPSPEFLRSPPTPKGRYLKLQSLNAHPAILGPIQTGVKPDRKGRVDDVVYEYVSPFPPTGASPQDTAPKEFVTKSTVGAARYKTLALAQSDVFDLVPKSPKKALGSPGGDAQYKTLALAKSDVFDVMPKKGFGI